MFGSPYEAKMDDDQPGGQTRPEAANPWRTLSAIRARSPVVHCITNLVAMDLVANVLLASGAAPAMARDAREVEDFVAGAAALTINIGTLSAQDVEPMATAARKAVELGRPWVLDPVGLSASTLRRETAERLAGLQPSVIRGNGGEILALGGGRAALRGMDSAIESAEALDAAHDLARNTGAVIAVTGAVDYVTDGRRMVAVANGHPMMTRVTAMGCALTGLLGACCAVTGDPLAATTHGLAIMGLAGEQAAAEAAGPGSLRVGFLDALHGMDQAALVSGARIE